MSSKILWTGLTIIEGIPAFESGNPLLMAAAIVMAIGTIAFWIDR